MWRDVLEELQILCIDCRLGKREDRAIAARTCVTLREACTHWIAGHRGYNRYGSRLLTHGLRWGMGAGKNDVRRQRDKFRCGRGGVGIGIRPTCIDPHVSTIGPPEFMECGSKRCQTTVPLRIALGKSHEHADAPHPLGLLLRPPAA
jgi:hypothetical protein